MSIHFINGLHYILGAPRWLEYAMRGLLTLLSVVAVGVLIGLVSERRYIHRGLWWVGVFCLVACARTVLIQIERWNLSLTLENLINIPAVVALLWGMHLRIRDATMGDVRKPPDARTGT